MNVLVTFYDAENIRFPLGGCVRSMDFGKDLEKKEKKCVKFPFPFQIPIQIHDSNTT